MKWYVGSHVDEIGDGDVVGRDTVTVLLRDPPCTAYFRVPKDQLGPWFDARPDKRHYYEVVDGPCRLVVQVAGCSSSDERDAVVAKVQQAVPGGGGASYPMGNAAARVVFPVTFAGLSDQALYVAHVLLPRLPPETRARVDATVYGKNKDAPLWPEALLAYTGPPVVPAWAPPPELREATATATANATANARARTTTAKVEADTKAEASMVASLSAYLTIALEGSRPVARRGREAVFFTLATGSTVCPRKGAPHRHNHASFVFNPTSLRGYFQCMDRACGGGGCYYRWGQRCYCVEAVGARCTWCGTSGGGRNKREGAR